MFIPDKRLYTIYEEKQRRKFIIMDIEQPKKRRKFIITDILKI